MCQSLCYTFTFRHYSSPPTPAYQSTPCAKTTIATKIFFEFCCQNSLTRELLHISCLDPVKQMQYHHASPTPFHSHISTAINLLSTLPRYIFYCDFLPDLVLVVHDYSLHQTRIKLLEKNCLRKSEISVGKLSICNVIKN